MYDRILAPTDGSDPAGTALEHAGLLAERFEATLVVVNAVEPWNLERYAGEDDSRLERARELVDTAAERVASGAGGVETAVDVGAPHEVILERALDCDLVVMGSHGRSGVSRMLLGSVTEKVVRLADTPMVTVRRPEGESVTYPYEGVLVATDASEGAAAAVQRGADIAAAHGATLHAVSVVDERMFRYGTPPESVREEFEGRAQRAVETAAGTATAAGVDAVTAAAVSGTPHRRLRTYVEDHDLDLVVMGTQGRTGFERYLLGSVAERMLRTSPAPVMTVRGPPEE